MDHLFEIPEMKVISRYFFDEGFQYALETCTPMRKAQKDFEIAAKYIQMRLWEEWELTIARIKQLL